MPSNATTRMFISIYNDTKRDSCSLNVEKSAMSLFEPSHAGSHVRPLTWIVIPVEIKGFFYLFKSAPSVFRQLPVTRSNNSLQYTLASPPTASTSALPSQLLHFVLIFLSTTRLFYSIFRILNYLLLKYNTQIICSHQINSQ